MRWNYFSIPDALETASAASRQRALLIYSTTQQFNQLFCSKYSTSVTTVIVSKRNGPTLDTGRLEELLQPLGWMTRRGECSRQGFPLRINWFHSVLPPLKLYTVDLCARGCPLGRAAAQRFCASLATRLPEIQRNIITVFFWIRAPGMSALCTGKS